MPLTPTSANSTTGEAGLPDALDPASINAPSLDLRAVGLRLVKGAAIYGAATFGIKALNFLLVLVFTRYLGPADYGIIALAETLAALVGLVAGMGFATGLTRFYFQYLGDPAALRRYVSTVSWASTVMIAGISGLALLFLPYLLAAFRFSVPFYPYLALAIGTAAFSAFSDLRLTLYRCEERSKAYAALSVVTFVLTTAAALVLVVAMRQGAVGMLLGRFLGAGVACAFAAVLLGRWFLGGWDWQHLRETFAISLPVVPHQAMALGLIAADRLILERYRPVSEVGLYSVAYTFGMVMYLVTSSVLQAWSPIFLDVARGGDAARPLLGRISSGLILFYVGVACFGCLIAQDVARLVLDPRYHAVGRVIPWVIGGYLFHGLFGLFHLAIMQEKRTGFLLAASFAACAANIALNFWWIPTWGMYGAAYATLAAYVLEALLAYAFGQRLFPLAFESGRILLALGVFGGVLALTQARSGIAWMSAGVLVSGALLWAIGGGEMVRACRTLARRPSAAS
ncbi:MAG TPA: oligosaccharide flippase family protein [Terriglobales bacterium]|nr:oligosaccharide flippase family protein [Terriglobales bacterium]